MFSILAHEFCHVFQFIRALDYDQREFLFLRNEEVVVPKLELHADYMSGFCLAKISKTFGAQGPDFVKRFGHTFFRLGDFNFARDNHHGTPAERFAATMAGYLESASANANAVEIGRAGVAFINQMKSI